MMGETGIIVLFVDKLVLYRVLFVCVTALQYPSSEQKFPANWSELGWIKLLRLWPFPLKV